LLVIPADFNRESSFKIKYFVARGQSCILSSCHLDEQSHFVISTSEVRRDLLQMNNEKQDTSPPLARFGMTKKIREFKMQTKEVNVNGKIANGVEIPLQNGTLVLITAAKGFIMCGYLDIVAANKFGDCAAIIKGVKTVDDMLQKSVVSVSDNASKLGIKEGMSGMEALMLLV